MGLSRAANTACTGFSRKSCPHNMRWSGFAVGTERPKPKRSINWFSVGLPQPAYAFVRDMSVNNKQSIEWNSSGEGAKRRVGFPLSHLSNLTANGAFIVTIVFWTKALLSDELKKHQFFQHRKICWLTRVISLMPLNRKMERQCPCFHNRALSCDVLPPCWRAKTIHYLSSGK